MTTIKTKPMPKTLTVGQAANRLGYSQRTIWRMLEGKKLTKKQAGPHCEVRIPAEEVEAKAREWGR